MELHVICHTCRRSHPLKHELDPEQKVRDFRYNHAGHAVEVRDLIGWALDAGDLRGNADIKIAYIATATVTIAPENVATSATFVAGWESAALDNGTNKYVDGVVSGKFTVGTTPTITTQLRLYGFAALDDTPTWPDVFDGTSSAETLTSVGVGNGFLKLAAICDVDSTTSDRVYPFRARKSLAQLFGFMPQDWGLYFTHNTGVNTNTSAGNHFVKVDYIYYTVTG